MTAVMGRVNRSAVTNTVTDTHGWSNYITGCQQATGFLANGIVDTVIIQDDGAAGQGVNDPPDGVISESLG